MKIRNTIISLLVVAGLVIASTARAADMVTTTPAVSVNTADTVKAVVATPATVVTTTVVTAPNTSGFVLASPAISGDMVYDFRAKSMGYGPSYRLGDFGKNQMFSIKAMWAVFPSSNTPNKLGVGLAVSVPKVLTALGVKNIPDWLTLDVGVLGLFDIQSKLEASVGIYATLIRIPL